MNQAKRWSALLSLPLFAACVADSRWPLIETQKWPAPMQDVGGAMDRGALRGVVLNEPGVEDVLVLRYGDPVQVRPAGSSASYPLPFHDKEVRLQSGSSVLCSPGGKVEILWEGGSSVVFSGRTTALIGSRSRLEPTLAFVELENATLHLREDDQVRLLGGALISAEVGPIALERLSASILRIENQSKADARLMFREADFRLGPGEEIHLPLLSDGGAPLAQAFESHGAEEGFPLRWDGSAWIGVAPSGARVEAQSSSELRGFGLRMQLDEGEAVILHGVDAPAGVGRPGADDEEPRAPEPAPEPEPAPLPEPALDPEESAPAAPDAAGDGGGEA